MKQRFSSLDIKVIAHELSKVLPTLRVSNIYDLSSRIFLFKFAKPGSREQFVIDSGFRCHLTSFARTTAAEPSAFVSRLRKFLKTRRVTSISQVGTDRILEFQFSDGQYRLFLEFYAGGNIVLTDKELKIIALLRNVNEGAEHEQIRFGSTYNLSERQNVNGIPPLTGQRVKDGLQKFIERQASNAEQAQAKKSKKKAGDTLRKALAGSISEFPPMLIDHALRTAEFDVQLSPQQVLEDESLVEKVLAALRLAGELVEQIVSNDSAKGYIIAKSQVRQIEATNSSQADEENAPHVSLLYDDFHPFKPKNVTEDEGFTILEFDEFNKTVDEFYSSIEGQRLESRLHEKEEAARKKLENARQDQQKRIGGLKAVQELNVRKAQAIEANLERVEEATAAINSLIAQGMDWVEIDRLIELEQKRHNPVADIIKLPLKLQENTATLLLGEWEEFEDEGYEGEDATDSAPSDSDDETEGAQGERSARKQPKPTQEDKRLSVDIDLALSGWSNAREYYDQKKTAAAKEEKTLQASAKALKSQQQKIDTDLKKALKQEKQVLRPVRKQFWFEKFVYFVSSDGYLVVGGRDAQQSDLLYKRHLKKGDTFVHAEPNGAACVVIKNDPATPEAPIPPSTLSQAGNLSISTSTCWDSKAVMPAWWVSADQVTKMAETGDYLGPGKFSIKGKKNFLPPAQLLLGFAVLFQISDDSKAKHKKHRVLDNPPVQEGQKAVLTPSGPEPTALNDEAEYATNDPGESDEGPESEEEEDEDDEAQTYHNPLRVVDKSTVAEPDGAAEEDEEQEAEAFVQVESQTSEQPNEAEEHDQPADDEFSESEADHDETTNENDSISAQSQPQQQQPRVRGKRLKRKKLATKYANQDEEDREVAMRLLGSRAGQDRAEEAARQKAAREAEAAEQKARRREQAERAQREGKAAEEAKRRAMLEDNDEEDADEDEKVDLDALVGTPLPGDEILEAIPICAPWAALGRYKYKAKMQPGAVKKGKAVREILGKWSADAQKGRSVVDDKSEDTERMWPKEVELIKSWKEGEVFNVVPVSKVRVMMSGGSGGTAGKGGKGAGQGKGKAGRGGKGSKKTR